MIFSEKLDLLMNITRTTNSALAHSISLDPSFVSRLRRGVRSPSKNENYNGAIARYFSRRFSTDYQKAALCEALKIAQKNLPSNCEKVAELLYMWFKEERPDEIGPVETFLDGLTHFKFKSTPKTDAIDASKILESSSTPCSVLYGIEGKRNAVIAFLSLVLESKSTQSLLLFSDESIEWLTGNREFTAKWASLLSQVIMQGNQIKIIHTINRNLDEMLSAIQEWLPVYMAGAIEPYYYPKIRDGVFRRTLFIAPKTAAVASTSVGKRVLNTANLLFTDKSAVSALVEEYNEYLSLCRPLMHIFTPKNRNCYLETLLEFENEAGDSIIKTDSLSFLTMPLDIAVGINSRMENEIKRNLPENYKMRIERFETSLQKYKFTEIITIPDINIIRTGQYRICFSDIPDSNVLFYTPEELSMHLQNIVRLLESYGNYNVHLSPNKEIPGYMLYVKENVGAIVTKTSLPSVVFAINESNMAAAFWDYMSLAADTTKCNEENKKYTISRLRAIIKKLNNCKS